MLSSIPGGKAYHKLRIFLIIQSALTIICWDLYVKDNAWIISGYFAGLLLMSFISFFSGI
jgi:hypothetical protein